jgi:hypothetical protein
MKQMLRFKSPTIFGSVLLAGLVFAGCSSAPSRADQGTVKARTFSFIDRGGAPAADFADSREQVHRLIQTAITENLAGKGVTKVASGGDITVAYLVIIGNNGSTEAINTYFGYGRDAFALHEKAQKAYTSSKNPNYFQAGTLLIDIVDSKSFKVLKRSYVTRPLLKNPTLEVRTAHIKEAVDAVLGDLRIAR